MSRRDVTSTCDELAAGPSKQPRIETESSFNSAFSNLKTSEFFKDFPECSKDESCIGPKSGPKLNTLLVNPKQKGNPLLKFITNVPWEFSDVVPDYVMGRTMCALFLSLRYHQLNPDYIHDRLKLLGNAFTLRVLVVQIDIAEPHHALKHLTRICILADLTLMLAWDAEDAGKIIETYKIYENKPPDTLMKRVDKIPQERIISALTTMRPINKTDAMTLLSTFGSLAGIVKAPLSALRLCPGFGAHKAEYLYKTLHEPFLKKTETEKKKDKPSTSTES
ncbi:DNA excision repair protein ERCC-1 [Orussus abietinus]|uniref:DNA excision repair protein ERCC-1 n=1 Tax=Orussus abietinus TaxID=222816 RepID=UPI0006252699|nr:DNA excision repair protein ERCC-1 [Orussus abietinus]XP_012288961.1 DNA excision repair protein ERCC-1 [Orussus abietinus]